MNRMLSMISKRLPFLIGFCALAVSIGLPAQAGPAPAPFDYTLLQQLSIHEDARSKPLDTFARETMRLITSREYWPESKVKSNFLARDPMTNLLSMLFEPDQWKDIAVIHLGSADVKKTLGIDPMQEWASYNDLKNNSAFRDAFKEIMRKQQVDEKLSDTDHKLGDLHGVLNRMDGIFYGTDLKIVPIKQEGSEAVWVSLDEISRLDNSDVIRTGFQNLMNGFLTSDRELFNSGTMALITNLRERGGVDYPTAKVLGYEIAYNEFKPFRKAWLFLLLGTILFAVSMGLSNPMAYYGAWAMSLTGFLLSSYGLGLRVLIAGRPPVSNMYESVVYMGWGVLLFAGIFELVYRQKIFGLCGAAMGVIVLTLADMLPFDPSISPLVPVLRSNYWLLIHVMTIVISYSAFALAMGIAHLALSFYLFSPHKKDLIRISNNFVYRAIQVGVLLLTAGTILGGVWANESWGRFWGWDPKETWAFISILGYLALLHARFTGLVGPFGVSVGAVIGFQLILMTWYGVNFILATGLHSYGFGAGGQGYVAAYLAIESAFLGLVAFRYKFFGDSLRTLLQRESDTKKPHKGTGGPAQPETAT